MFSQTRRAVLLPLAALLVGAGCSESPTTDNRVNLVATAQAAGDFNTLLTAVEAAGLTETLRTDGPFTVFAPTDAAFAQVPQETLNALLADPDALGAVLTYHVVAGEVTSTQARQLTSAPTVNGAALAITQVDGQLFVGGARVVQADIRASNGIIHVIDGVLIP
jgi:uncharacterized surface protein with fasciclin (FAS1) repeats